MYLWQIRQFPNNQQNQRHRNTLRSLLILSFFPLLTSQLEGQEPKAKPAAAQESTEDSAAQAFFKKALAENRQRKSVRAQLQEAVSITDQPLRLTGQYLEAGSKSRLELKLKLSDDARGELLEISDGEILWNRTLVGDTPQVTLRSLKQIAAAVADQPQLQADPGPPALGLGGLVGLLTSLDRTMQFSQLKEDKTADGQVVTIQGTWKSEFARQWQPDPAKELPSYIPDALRISFDPQTLFPRRFLYLKRHSEKKTFRPLVRLEFQDVQLDAEIDDQLFEFTPPEGEVPDDVTQQYIDQLKQRTAAQETPKKSPSPGKSRD